MSYSVNVLAARSQHACSPRSCLLALYSNMLEVKCKKMICADTIRPGVASEDIHLLSGKAACNHLLGVLHTAVQPGSVKPAA